MTQSDFDGCWAKLERAHHHIATLEGYFRDEFSSESNRPRVGIKFKSDTGEHVVYVSHMPEVEQPLLYFSVTVGDAVHNMRSALDHLTFQLALRNSNGNIKKERRVQFPIEDSPRSFQRRCTDTGGQGWLVEVAATDQSIIGTFQPYGGSQEGEFLALLRDLSDADKHRLLAQLAVPGNYLDNASMRVGMIMNTAIRAAGGIKNALPKIRSIELGTELYGAIMPGWEETNVDMAGYIVPVVGLRHKEPPPYKLGFALNVMHNTVLTVLKRFTPAPRIAPLWPQHGSWPAPTETG